MQKLAMGIVLLAITIAGCAQQPVQQGTDGGCTQIITPARSPDGACIEFPTPCAVPEGYTKVETCTQPEEPKTPEEPAPQKYSFDANILFCDYIEPVDKFLFFYQIRNYTENPPPNGSAIWIVAPDMNYSQKKTVNEEYGKGRLFWEENAFTYGGTRYRGQSWEIRNVTSFAPLEYSLVFCEVGGQEPCSGEAAIQIDSGITTEKCRNTAESG